MNQDITRNPLAVIGLSAEKLRELGLFRGHEVVRAVAKQQMSLAHPDRQRPGEAEKLTAQRTEEFKDLNQALSEVEDLQKFRRWREIYLEEEKPAQEKDMPSLSAERIIPEMLRCLVDEILPCDQNQIHLLNPLRAPLSFLIQPINLSLTLKTALLPDAPRLTKTTNTKTTTTKYGPPLALKALERKRSQALIQVKEDGTLMRIHSIRPGHFEHEDTQRFALGFLDQRKIAEAYRPQDIAGADVFTSGIKVLLSAAELGSYSQDRHSFTLNSSLQQIPISKFSRFAEFLSLKPGAHPGNLLCGVSRFEKNILFSLEGWVTDIWRGTRHVLASEARDRELLLGLDLG